MVDGKPEITVQQLDDSMSRAIEYLDYQSELTFDDVTEMIKELRQRLDTERGKQQQLEAIISEKSKKISMLELKLIDVEEAKEITQLVAKQTQEKLEYHVSNLVTMALSAVFDDPYEFLVEFDTKYNKTVCNLWFVRGGNKIKPVDGAGVGAVDVAAFGLRTALLTLEKPERRRLMILDEPMKHLRGEDNQRRCGEMISMIADELNMQVIMTSDVLFAPTASKVFEVTINNGVSEVKEIE